MYLKRLYDRSDPKNPKVNGVEVLRAGKRQHFTPDFVARGHAQGWLTLRQNLIVIGKDQDAVTYRIRRMPGYYCCHCARSLDDGGSARVHIEAEHPKKKSPDAQNPAGYERINYYDCVKE